MTKLEQLQAALDASTPGEWDYAIINSDCPIRSLVTNQHGDELLRHKYGVSAVAQHDVDFIALAHNHMAALLRIARAAQGVIDNWERGDLAGAVCNLDGCLDELREESK